MRKLSKILLTTFFISISLIPIPVFAADYDFSIESNMEIKYEKRNDYVEVQIEYIREVKNSDYYFPASGDKTFPIPDLSSQNETQIENERKFKKDSLSVVDSSGKKISYTTKETEDGINVVIPNYKQTTKSSPYKVYVKYNTHDYVQVVNQNIVIQAPSLPKDTEFKIEHEKTGTTTKVDYNLDIVIDKEVSALSKIWPTTFTKTEEDNFDIYSFPAQSRITQNPYIEFGTSQIYRFELEYLTPKTDNIIPEKYSEVFSGISTNIFELSLPRYFDETNQIVEIESISPTPTKIGRDDEGNIIATFEVEANKDSKISVIGYVWVQQDEYNSKRSIPNPTIEEYAAYISSDQNLNKYLADTQFWQVNDPYIQEEAQKIKISETKVLDLIKADYRYINEQLEYDQTKADSINDRIGAKQALQGDSAVCMEYADSMISILRAQGIASRAAIGYANLKDASDTPASQVRHQWLQVWIPDYGWLSIDPVWESENMDIGPNIHKLLWETFNGEDLSNTRIYSADSLDSINDIQFNISVYAVEQNDISNIEELKTYEEILPIEDLEESSNIGDWLNKFVKASTVGRSVAIVLPIILIVILLVILIALTRSIIKKQKSKKENRVIKTS
jgi:transglutaminase-like putative cysteine protease